MNPTRVRGVAGRLLGAPTPVPVSAARRQLEAEVPEDRRREYELLAEILCEKLAPCLVRAFQEGIGVHVRGPADCVPPSESFDFDVIGASPAAVTSTTPVELARFVLPAIDSGSVYVGVMRAFAAEVRALQGAGTVMSDFTFRVKRVPRGTPTPELIRHFAYGSLNGTLFDTTDQGLQRLVPCRVIFVSNRDDAGVALTVERTAGAGSINAGDAFGRLKGWWYAAQNVSDLTRILRAQ